MHGKHEIQSVQPRSFHRYRRASRVDFRESRIATKGRGLLDEPKESLLGQGEGTVTCVRSALRRNLLARTRLWEFAWTRFFDQSVKLLRGR